MPTNHLKSRISAIAITMLRIIRIILALLSFCAVTLLFVDFTGFAAEHWNWIAKYQFMPALLSLNIVAIAVLLLATWLFGRIYCSVVCPLGIMQDVVTRLRLWLSPRRKRKVGIFRYHKGKSVLRYGILACFAVLIALGFVNLFAASLASFIEPYAAYGRISSGVFAPVVDWINNMLAGWAAEHDSLAFYEVYRVTSLMVTIVGAVTLLIVGLLAAVDGRWYCNTVCPVGTTLGCVSRFSLFKPVIDTDKCNGCRSCERHCKSSCIDASNHKIDLSRCVACMDCIDHCRQGAISYAIKPSVPSQPKKDLKQPAETDASRRAMVTLLGAMGGTLAVKAAGVADGGLTALLERKRPIRAERITPPGSVSQHHLTEHCVACQLCVQNCPNGVLRPSTDLETFMQPVMDYSDGYCTPECTRCADVCPAGVFIPMDEATKSSTKIGTAKVDLDICLSASRDVSCGNCARNCPAGAITMAPVSEAEDESRQMPVVDENACIGCGACEYHCPVGRVESTGADHPAIHVDGITVQRNI